MVSIGYSLGDIDVQELVVLQRHYLNMTSAISAELVARSQAVGPPRPATEHGATMREATALDPLFHSASHTVREAALQIVERLRESGGLGEPLLERTRDGSPRYFRLTSGRETVAYVWVQRDGLRIDLPLSVDQLGQVRAKAKKRDVQAKNPWKTALYVASKRDVDSALEAIETARRLVERKSTR